MGTSTLALVNKGYNFELVTNGVSESGDKLSMTFLPLVGSDMGAAELYALFNDESEFDVKNDNVVMTVYRNFTLCNSVEFIANYSLGTFYHCPKCNADIEDPNAKSCPSCGDIFGPTPVEETVVSYHCPVCNAVVEENATTCPNCNAAFEAPTAVEETVTVYHCPKCNAVVDQNATTCPNCNAAFDAPVPVEVKSNVWKVVNQIPDINNRMNDAEEAIEDIISVIL